MKPLNQLLNIRNDSAGQGHFGAFRSGGKRSHSGIDYLATPGGGVMSPVDGTVSKLGWVYKGDSKYRYVEVMDEKERKHRLFYVQPDVKLVRGQKVQQYDVIGSAQDVSEKHGGGMQPHVHYEVKDHTGQYQDPSKL